MLTDGFFTYLGLLVSSQSLWLAKGIKIQWEKMFLVHTPSPSCMVRIGGCWFTLAKGANVVHLIISITLNEDHAYY
jgi:hypothetical protein